MPAMVATLLVLEPTAGLAQPPAADADAGPLWRYGAFVDVGYLGDPNHPTNQRFRNRGSTPRVNDVVIDMAAAWLRRVSTDASRWGMELTGHGGEDAKAFGFSSSAPPVRGAEVLTHLGPTNVSYLAPVGRGLTVQGGIFSSLIGYDGLYARDNFSYTRPWGADYTPYLMLGIDASYPLTSRLTGTFAVVNGYFHLSHANDVPSVAAQFAYRPREGVSLKQTVLTGPHQSTTTVGFWRMLSDTILERRGARLVTAVEYQLGVEPIDAIGNPRALWMSVQAPVHWVVRHPWSVTIRPEWTWDRDGRWIAGVMGLGQSIGGLTSTVEYRLARGRTAANVRLEHRYDRSAGAGAGFYKGADGLTPRQHLLIVAVTASVEDVFHR
jgi:hypothetical protein